MMTTELTSKSMLRWGARALAAWGLALGCGGTATTEVTLGSESHFLAYCDSVCDGGFDCIGGICTRSCMAGGAECSSIGAGVECTNQSVEPGEVAVCDVRCTRGGDCLAVGSDYACEGGYCRTGSRGDGAGGSGSASGSGGADGSGASGAGGSGGANGNAGGLNSCEDFRDAPKATSEAEGIVIVNDGPELLYVQPEAGCREADQTLVSVQRDGQFLELSPICVASCERALNEGWSSGAGEGNTDNQTCPYKPCERAPVQIAPGQTLVRTSTLEYALRRLPRECADGIETEAVNCLSLVDSPPGNYTLQVRAAVELSCRSDSDCDCRPGPDGTCSNGNVYLARTPLTISANVPELPGQTLAISRDRGCNELRERLLLLRAEQVANGTLLAAGPPCEITEADFNPYLPQEQIQGVLLIFQNSCSDLESTCVD